MDAVRAAESSGKLLSETTANMELWFQDGFLPRWAIRSIEELVSQEAWSELNDRFYKNLSFGTGGMRGRTIGGVSTSEEVDLASGTSRRAAVGTNLLNDFNVIRATIGLFRYSEAYLKGQCSDPVKPKLVIAHDIRYFSHHFSVLAASVWSQLGGIAYLFDGPRSTPQLSFSVRHLKATAGIVITASHNPPHDNGYKVYFGDGAQVVSPHAESIMEEVNKVALKEIPPYLEIVEGSAEILTDSMDKAYLDLLEGHILSVETIKEQRPKVVYTPIHGTGQVSAVPLMSRLGVDLHCVEAQMTMDPKFSTVVSPNPENAEALTMGIELAREGAADLVIGTDPDGDRMGVAVRDASGDYQLLNGNAIGCLLAEYRICKLKELGYLPKEGSTSAALIKTFVTTRLQEAIAAAHGLKCINTLTGFKWIGEKLLEYENVLKAKMGPDFDYDRTPFKERVKLLLEHSTFYVFGGEESYGYLASDLVRDKDANAAAALFCELVAYLKEQGKTPLDYLDEIYLKYGYFTEGVLSISHEGASGSEKISNILDSYRQVPPKRVGDFAVEKMTDFGKESIFDLDGKKIPAQDFFFIELSEGYSYAVRASGTEPKIKFYLFAHERVGLLEELPRLKLNTKTKLETLKTALKADAQKRAL